MTTNRGETTLEQIYASNDIVTLENVFFRYPTSILPEGQEWLIKIKDLSLKSQETYSLLGDNMTGKSTLIQLLSGTLPKFRDDCYKGNVSIIGTKKKFPVNPLEMKKIGIVVVQQSDPMFPELSIWDNLELGCPSHSFFKMQKREAKERAKKVIEELDSSHKISLDTPFGELSGGGKALFKILRATIWQYKLLLLDEPTANLDPRNRIKCFDLLDHMWIEDASILLVSHNEDDHRSISEVAKKKKVDYLCYELKDGIIIQASL